MRRKCRERFHRHRPERKPLVSDPGRHHGTLTRGGGENVPGIPGGMRNPQFYVSGKRLIRQTMTSDSYFWFNDGNKMKDIYSHNHQMRNWYAKAHKSTYRVKDDWENLIDLRHTHDRIKPNKNFDRYLWSTEYDNTITSDIQPHDMTTMGNVDNSDDSIDDDNKMSYRYIISII